MSRIERYKHIHEESKKEEKKEGIFARREKKRTEKDVEDIWQPRREQASTDEQYGATNQRVERQTREQYQRTERHQPENPVNNHEKIDQNHGRPTPKKAEMKPPKKPRKKRRRSWLKVIIWLIVGLFAYSGVAFALGQYVANKDTSVPQEEKETFNGVTSSSGANNILLLGSDSRDGEVSRADTIMVLQLDGTGKKPKLISFMRDTLVSIPGYGDNKLNAAYAFGGAELVRQTLVENFGINTKYYVSVDFKSFEKVIDTLFTGGVQIDAEKDMSDYIDVAIKKGPQKMDGLTLLQYARFRMDEEGDFGRVRRQQQVMDAIFSAMKNPLAIIKLPYAAGKVMGYASTDLPMSYLLKNTFNIASGASGIDRLTVPVEDSWSYGTTSDGASVLVVDFDQNRNSLASFLTQ